jgi:hypothetical protein
LNKLPSSPATVIKWVVVAAMAHGQIPERQQPFLRPKPQPTQVLKVNYKISLLKKSCSNQMATAAPFITNFPNDHRLLIVTISSLIA